MGLAKYFSKDALAITQVLNSNSVQKFESILNKNLVEIIFDSGDLTQEGTVSLDLIVRLIARLYPKIKITDLANGRGLVDSLRKQAIEINANIELIEEEATISLVLGKKNISNTTSKVFYFGSDGWLVKLSTSRAMGSGNSALPFAAGFAACMAASNCFRYVFQELIPDAGFDDDVTFSLLHLNCSDYNENVNPVKDFGKVVLAGLGAIGNGVLWTLSKIKDVKGEIVLVDPEMISLSNLQRYVIAIENDEGLPKTDLANRIFSETKFTFEKKQDRWQNYVAKNKYWSNDFVLTALDSAKDRVAVQSSLPENILNGFTEEGLLGVSRHFDFLKAACISCMYMPTQKKISRSEEVAINLGIPQHEKQYVRNYIYFNSPVDENLLKLIGGANKIDFSELKRFVGTPMSEFYSKFVCGGILLKLKPDVQNSPKMEAPLVFQSVLAGILLVSELYLFKAGFRDKCFPNVTHIYPLIPLNSISNPYNHKLAKDQTGRCICTDDDYKAAFLHKWCL
jgi:hypothetical protein